MRLLQLALLSLLRAAACGSAAASYPERPIQLPTSTLRFMYAASVVNPCLAVLCNDYSVRVHVHGITPKLVPKGPATTMKIYGALFYFARLKPRVAFAIGSVLRALQLTTAVQYVFDPGVGVGIGLNILTMLCDSRWPAAVVLGWIATKPMWRLLGARSPSSVPFPIKLSGVAMRSSRGGESR